MLISFAVAKIVAIYPRTQYQCMSLFWSRGAPAFKPKPSDRFYHVASRYSNYLVQKISYFHLKLDPSKDTHNHEFTIIITEDTHEQNIES